MELLPQHVLDVPGRDDFEDHLALGAERLVKNVRHALAVVDAQVRRAGFLLHQLAQFGNHAGDFLRLPLENALQDDRIERLIKMTRLLLGHGDQPKAVSRAITDWTVVSGKPVAWAMGVSETTPRGNMAR